MLKKTIPLVLATFIFAGCSLKMPSFSMPSFLQFEDKDLLSLEEASVCEKIESLDSKLTCYKKLLEKNNSYSQLRMGTYHADRKEYKDAIKYLNLSKENETIVLFTLGYNPKKIAQLFLALASTLSFLLIIDIFVLRQVKT